MSMKATEVIPTSIIDLESRSLLSMSEREGEVAENASTTTCITLSSLYGSSLAGGDGCCCRGGGGVCVLSARLLRLKKADPPTAAIPGEELWGAIPLRMERQHGKRRGREESGQRNKRRRGEKIVGRGGRRGEKRQRIRSLQSTAANLSYSANFVLKVAVCS